MNENMVNDIRSQVESALFNNKKDFSSIINIQIKSDDNLHLPLPTDCKKWKEYTYPICDISFRNSIGHRYAIIKDKEIVMLMFNKPCIYAEALYDYKNQEENGSAKDTHGCIISNEQIHSSTYSNISDIDASYFIVKYDVISGGIHDHSNGLVICGACKISDSDFEELKFRIDNMIYTPISDDINIHGIEAALLTNDMRKRYFKYLKDINFNTRLISDISINIMDSGFRKILTDISGVDNCKLDRYLTISSVTPNYNTLDLIYGNNTIKSIINNILHKSIGEGVYDMMIDYAINSKVISNELFQINQIISSLIDIDLIGNQYYPSYDYNHDNALFTCNNSKSVTVETVCDRITYIVTERIIPKIVSYKEQIQNGLEKEKQDNTAE